MQTLRMGFAEPIAAYAASVTVLCASDSTVAMIERARNEAVRVQTGCVQSSPVERLRALVHLPSMQEVATVQAARLYEKSMRMDRKRSTPLQTALADYTIARICKKRSTLKRKAELRLADVGLLQLPRAPLPAEPGLHSLEHVNFHYAPCTKQEGPIQQRQAVESLKQALPAAHCEVWTGGSVGQPPMLQDERPRRIAVVWDDGWYAGSI